MEQNMALDSDLQLRYEKYKGALKELTLMSDIFMRNVFKKQECTEYILQVIMEQTGLKVIDQIIQKDYKNLQGRSAILDCVARDSEGRKYDVEVQQEKEGASPKRARYHSGLMDMNILESGQDFDELKENYVIFITRNDVIGFGLPIYHVNRVLEENGESFQDGSHIIYVNSEIQDETVLGKLMYDFHCKNAEEMYSSILAERVRELKETPEGVDLMCLEMEKIYQDGMAKGLADGELKAKKETVISLAEMGFPVDKIAQAVKLGIQLVQEWITESMSHAN